MSSTPRIAFGVLRGAYGALLLCSPEPVLRRYAGHPPDVATRRVGRVLGLRQLAQASLTAGAVGPVVHALGLQVDLAHAASMLGLAAAEPRYRRAAMCDAATAGAFAAAGAALIRRRLRDPVGDPVGNPAPGSAREAMATRIARTTVPAGLRRTLTRGR